MEYYIVGFDKEMLQTYESQVKAGTRDDYIWEFQRDDGTWGLCQNAYGQCEPLWGGGHRYRASLKSCQKNIDEQKIRLLESKIEEIRGDYKKLVDDFKGLISDLAPSLTGDQLRMVGKRTGNWFVVIEQKPLYIIR